MDEAIKLQRAEKYVEALQLLKEVERLNKAPMSEAVCGMKYNVMVNDSFSAAFKKFYFREYLSDTTKSILKGVIINNRNTAGSDTNYIPFVQVKLTNLKDSTIIQNSDLNGEFLIELNRGEYKLEISNQNFKFSKTIELTNAPYMLTLNIDEYNNTVREFKLTKFELNDLQHYWIKKR